jgi:hypothetical protein
MIEDYPQSMSGRGVLHLVDTKVISLISFFVCEISITLPILVFYDFGSDCVCVFLSDVVCTGSVYMLCSLAPKTP